MLKNLAYLAAFTTFVVLVWISLSIYNSITSTTVTKTERVQIIPLPPTFNVSVVNSLKERIQVPINLSEQIASSISAQVPPPTISLPPQPSPSPTVNPLLPLQPSPTIIASPTPTIQGTLNVSPTSSLGAPTL